MDWGARFNQRHIQYITFIHYNASNFSTSECNEETMYFLLKTIQFKSGERNKSHDNPIIIIYILSSLVRSMGSIRIANNVEIIRLTLMKVDQ